MPMLRRPLWMNWRYSIQVDVSVDSRLTVYIGSTRTIIWDRTRLSAFRPRNATYMIHVGLSCQVMYTTRRTGLQVAVKKPTVFRAALQKSNKI